MRYFPFIVNSNLFFLKIGLEKLEEVKLRSDNLGDILLLCGEIIETIRSIDNEPSGIKSHPMSQTEFFEED